MSVHLVAGTLDGPIPSEEYADLQERLARETVRADQLHDALRPFVERPARISAADHTLARLALSDSTLYTEHAA